MCHTQARTLVNCCWRKEGILSSTSTSLVMRVCMTEGFEWLKSRDCDDYHTSIAVAFPAVLLLKKCTGVKSPAGASHCHSNCMRHCSRPPTLLQALGAALHLSGYVTPLLLSRCSGSLEQPQQPGIAIQTCPGRQSFLLQSPCPCCCGQTQPGPASATWPWRLPAPCWQGEACSVALL